MRPYFFGDSWTILEVSLGTERKSDQFFFICLIYAEFHAESNDLFHTSLRPSVRPEARVQIYWIGGAPELQNWAAEDSARVLLFLFSRKKRLFEKLR